jgi:hypothetical protein
VQVSDDVAGRTTTGTVTAVGAYTAGAAGSSDAKQPQSGPGYPVTITPTAPLDASWAGADVLVRITGATTGGSVLTVPAAAIVQDASGATSVVVHRADGTDTPVPVHTGMIVDGTVQVTPDASGALAAGDVVVTG